LVSSRAGINLSIQIIAVKNGERPCLLLGMGRESKEGQQRPRQKKNGPKPLGFHSLHLLHKYLYPISPFKTSTYDSIYETRMVS
jgi:hypothetical protein